MREPRAGGAYGLPCPESRLRVYFTGGSWCSRSKSNALTMLWPGRRTPLARNTRRYGSPVLVMPLAFSISIRSGSPLTTMRRWVSTIDELLFVIAESEVLLLHELAGAGYVGVVDLLVEHRPAVAGEAPAAALLRK